MNAYLTTHVANAILRIYVVTCYICAIIYLQIARHICFSGVGARLWNYAIDWWFKLQK